MNQALKDAQTLYLLLQKHKDEFEKVLPEYSEMRVKEGHALSDLAMHLYCLDAQQQLRETVHMIVRGALHKWFPQWVAEHPQSMIGMSKYGLAHVYDHAYSLGIIQKHRAINHTVRQTYFEQTTGMVSKETYNRTKNGWKKWAAAVGGVAAAAAVAHVVGSN